MRSVLVALGLTFLLLAGVFKPGRAEEEAAPQPEPEPEYVGPSLCMRCHFAHHKAWLGTAHARATDVLAPGRAPEAKRRGSLDVAADYREDAKCLCCHATGYGRQSGFPASRAAGPATTRDRLRATRTSGVTCEACHGAGSRFWRVMERNKRFRIADIVARGAVVPVKAAQCERCHGRPCPTVDSEYEFDFERDHKPAAVHPQFPLRYPH